MNRIRNRNNHLDQYYTSPQLIKQCVKEIKQVSYPKYIIDTSCGNNLFVQEMNLPYESYDIDPPKDYYGEITKTNFLKQNIKQIPKETLMGFNPPFGWRSHLAKQFVLKMMELKPKYIALILLEPSTTMKWQFSNYKILFEKEVHCHVPCRFFVLEYQNTNDILKQLLPRKSTRYKTNIPGLKVTREKRVRINMDCIFVRFTGVNAGLEYYILYYGYIFHILFENFKTNSYKIVLKDCFKHNVESTTFTKIYFPFDNFKMMRDIVSFLHEKSSSVINIRAIRYNFTTFDVTYLMDEYLKN